MNLFASLTQALDVTIPICALILLGTLLKHRHWINDDFIQIGTTLVFRASMPTLIFFAVLNASLAHLNPRLLVFFAIATVASFLFSWIWARFRIASRDRGAFVQGAFRGNGSILGIAFSSGMYGPTGVSLAALLVAVLIPVYNILSVIVLAVYQRNSDGINVLKILTGILKNPLIQSVIAAVIWRTLRIPMPEWLARSGHDLASLTLPLALLCIGGALSFKGLKETSRSLFEAVALKTLLLPILMTLTALLVGYRGAELGTLFIYFASPTATSAFVMAVAMGANKELTAGIIALSTLTAMITVSIGLCLIQYSGL